MLKMRYSRQITFDKVGKEGQLKLTNSHVIVVGCGALGSVAAELLVRAGVGKVTLVDRDLVEMSNLQRQSLFSEGDVGKAKALAAKDVLGKINSQIKINVMVIDLDFENVNILDADLVLDCTDNLQTRFLINEYCRKNKIPVVFCSVIGAKGMVLPVMPDDNFCFRCVFQEAQGLETCETVGILNTTPHALVAFQVTYALKIILKVKFNPTLIHFDLWDLKLSKLKVKRNSACPVCSGRFEYLEGKSDSVVRLCGSGQYQIKGNFDFEKVKQRLRGVGEIEDYDEFFKFKELIIFNGRVLIKAITESEARSLYSKFIGD